MSVIFMKFAACNLSNRGGLDRSLPWKLCEQNTKSADPLVYPRLFNQVSSLSTVPRFPLGYKRGGRRCGCRMGSDR